jgi:glucosamine--fructose-6-phosphate aminotransferase (isomerizing)
LQSKGYKFKSQTDTEVIAILIGYFLDQKKDLMTAVKLTCEKLDGTWGFLIIHKDYPE